MSTKLGTLTLDLVARIGNFTAGMRQASSSAEREMGRASSSVNVMNGMLGKLAATAGAAFSVGQIISYTDKYTGLQNKLKLVTNSQSELNAAMQDTFAIAQNTGSAWDSTAMVYQRFADNAKRLGITMAETASLTETVSKAISISGGSAASAEAALMQFGQALASGVLRGEEFNSISEQAPGLLKAIAKGMGVNIGELRAMAGEGKITGDVLVDSLSKAKPYIDDLFNKTDFTIGNSVTQLSNAVTQFVGEAGKGSGAASALSDSIGFLAKNLSAVTNTMMIGATFMAGTYIPVIYGAITAGYARTKQIVEQTAIQYAAISAERTAAASSLAQAQAQLVNTQSTLAALAAEKALEVQRLQAQINAIGRMASTTRMAQLRQIEVQVTAELTAAETALAAARTRATAAAAAGIGVGRTALGILGGPVGMGITLAAVAAGYLLMKDGADKATSSIDIQGQSVDDLIVKYRELNTLQRDNETKALAEQVQDLAVKFRVASSDLSSFMEALPASDEKIDFFVKLTKEYQNGKISNDKYYEAVKKGNFLTDEQLDKVRSLVGRYDEAKGKFNAAEIAQDALSKAMSGTTQEVKEQAAGVKGLTEELKKLLGINAEGTNKSNYLKEMVDLKVDPKLAEMLYEARKAEGLQWGKNQVLSDAVRKSVLERWKAEQGLNKTLEERAKIEDRNKKAIEAQGNAMKVNALVASNAAKANYAALESAKSLPKGLLSAVNMTESPNSNTARSGAGARGAFQFMPKTADRFNVDVNSVNSSAKGAAEYLDKLFKMFEGNLENALRAYNWGEGNMQNYLKYGSGMKKKNGKWQKGYFADKPMPKETREYSGKVMGYMGGASGVSFNEDYSFDDWAKEQEKLVMEREKREKEQAEKQKQLALEVATYKERINTELADKIKEINEAGFGEAETKRLTAEYQNRAAIDIQVSEASHADKISEYSDYLKSEEQLLSESYARRQRDLKLDLSLTVDEYKKASLLLEGERDKELQKARWRALEIRQAMVDQIKGLSGGADNIFAQATMSPADYNRWSLENDRSNAQVDLKSQRVGVEQDIMTSNSYSTDEDRYEALLEAHREYRYGMAAIDVDYAERTKELDTQQYTDKMNMYGSLLAQAGAVWGTMTQMVKDSAGEGSAAYKTMFFAQQAIAIGQAIINTELGATAALKIDPTGFMSMATRGMGYASVGLIAAQTISGMAHDGIDNIPKEGTWLLDKGERVVDSRTNSDLKNYLAEGGGGGGDVHISVQVTDSGVSTQSNQSDQKQLGQMIGNAVRTVIRQEQRQGGLLSK